MEEERGDSRGEEAPISKPSLGLESSEMDDYSTFLCPLSVRLLLAKGERDSQASLRAFASLGSQRRRCSSCKCGPARLAPRLARQAGNAILEGPPPPRPTVWGGRVCSRGARVWGDCRLTVTAEGGRGRHRREQRRWRRRQRASGSRVQRSVRSTPQLRPILRLACH